MIYCLKCGNKMSDDDLFYHKCGAKKNCNSESFVITESKEAEFKLNENNGIIERCKCLVSKFILRR